MVDDQGNKDDKFDFTDEGEAKYIGLDEARIIAIQAAIETPGNYGRRYSDVRFVFAPLEDEETEEYYRVVLSVRLQGSFRGIPGREEFYVEKLAQADGAIATRQVLAVPMPERRRRPAVMILAVAVLVVVVASGVVGVLYIGGVLPTIGSVEDEPVQVAVIPLLPDSPVSPPSTEAQTSIPVALLTPTPVEPTHALRDNRSIISVRTPLATPTPRTRSFSRALEVSRSFFSRTPLATPSPRTLHRLDLEFILLLTPIPTPRWFLKSTPTPKPTPVFTSPPTTTPKPIPTAVPTPTRTPLPPNLVPFQPERWNAPLVFSDTRATFLDFPPPGGTEFVFGPEVFVHWAVRNEGELVWWDEVPFQVVLTMDGDPWLTFSLESLGHNEIARMMNIQLIMDSPGNHQFMLIVDMGNEVAESNEFDNIFLVNTRWIDRSWTPTPSAK